VDTEDVFVDDKSAIVATVKDAIVIKGHRAPFVFDTDYTPHGMVVAVDGERNKAFVLRWSGTERGAAAELGALTIDRAHSWEEFRAALARWRMPARRAVYLDAEGNVGYQDAALIPQRRGTEWTGWVAPDDLPHAFNPPRGIDVPSSSNGDDAKSR